VIQNGMATKNIRADALWHLLGPSKTMLAKRFLG
jgi:hypothetical protein